MDVGNNRMTFRSSTGWYGVEGINDKVSHKYPFRHCGLPFSVGRRWQDGRELMIACVTAQPNQFVVLSFSDSLSRDMAQWRIFGDIPTARYGCEPIDPLAQSKELFQQLTRRARPRGLQVYQHARYFHRVVAGTDSTSGQPQLWRPEMNRHLGIDIMLLGRRRACPSSTFCGRSLRRWQCLLHSRMSRPKDDEAIVP